MVKKVSILLSYILFIFACRESSQAINEEPIYKTDQLIIFPLTENVYQHISYLEVDGNKYGCNGIVYKNRNEAVVFDTPAGNEASLELISWIKNDLGSNINAVVPTHFHVDCLGGLDAFHGANINSFGSEQTVNFAVKDAVTVPLKHFGKSLRLQVGEKWTDIRYFGPGHTLDNVVVHIADENLLFGGCLIKEMNATKGNLADADVAEWSITVGNIKEAYPNLVYVVPGHGKSGGPELLSYTIDLFDIKD